MTIVNEIENRALYRKLLFPEFLDFLVRIADIVFRNTEAESFILPRKLERLLDKFLPVVRMIRKEVNIDDLMFNDDSDAPGPNDKLEL